MAYKNAGDVPNARKMLIESKKIAAMVEQVGGGGTVESEYGEEWDLWWKRDEWW